MVRQGDIVAIKPEYQDAGDSQFVWTAIEDEDGGRVKITADVKGMAIKPVQVILVSMLEA